MRIKSFNFRIFKITPETILNHRPVNLRLINKVVARRYVIVVANGYSGTATDLAGWITVLVAAAAVDYIAYLN